MEMDDRWASKALSARSRAAAWAGVTSFLSRRWTSADMVRAVADGVVHEDAAVPEVAVAAVAPLIGSRARVRDANPVSAAAERMWGASWEGDGGKATKPEILPNKDLEAV